MTNHGAACGSSGACWCKQKAGYSLLLSPFLRSFSLQAVGGGGWAVPSFTAEPSCSLLFCGCLSGHPRAVPVGPCDCIPRGVAASMTRPVYGVHACACRMSFPGKRAGRSRCRVWPRCLGVDIGTAPSEPRQSLMVPSLAPRLTPARRPGQSSSCAKSCARRTGGARAGRPVTTRVRR